MAEAEMRSNQNIVFPRGFVTPKVGPHQTYGFQAGNIFGESATLQSTENVVTCDKPQIDYIVAKSEKGNRSLIVFLNNQSQPVNAKLTWGEKSTSYKKVTVKDDKGKILSTNNIGSETSLSLGSYGLKVLVLE
jgi:hypothetical protein